MTALAHFWDRITATGPVLATWLVALTAAIAFVVVASHRVWHVSRNVVTLAHEGGHAVVSIASGRRLDGIRLHSDTSGVTSSRGKNHGPGLILTTAAGYVTPSLLGLVLFLLAATFVAIRNAYGFLAVLAVAVLVFLISRFASLRAQEVFAYLFAWFLLFGGIRPVFELQRRRRRGGALSSDADQLALLTGVPGGAWTFLFGLVAFASLVAGAYLLLPGLSHWLLSSTS
jgi:hypothetical protein